ncbi:MAG: cobalamin biosynthesis protein CobD [Burkholderiales bacterium]|nr:cobalamin biosynthesis protein CobD [Burkholderiales bacterium]
MTAWMALVALLFAFCLDRWFGEPVARWHPVVWMGHYLAWAGRRVAPRQAGSWLREFLGGALGWLAGAGLVLLAAWAFQWSLVHFPEWAAALLIGIALKPMLAWRMLREEAGAVERALAESLPAGRERLAMLVSRDVSELSEAQVRESAIESLAENLNDSVVAPVFWFVVLGLPGAALYRFANTADAMWGYRGERGGRVWEWAGKFAARADDALSWIPARLTALLIAGCAGGLPWSRLRGEARRTPSPNSGWPMAAMALALGVRLAKPGVYALNALAREPAREDGGQAQAVASRVVLALLSLASLAIVWLRSWE